MCGEDMTGIILCADLTQSLKTERPTGTENHHKLAKKYTEIPELNSEIMNTFIEKIIVHERVKSEGKTIQKIEFVFKGIGKLELGKLKI